MEPERNREGSGSQSHKGAVAVEKRRHPRYSVEFPLDYSLVDSQTPYNAGLTADASEGGLLVYIPERIETGTVLRIQIFHSKGPVLETITATVKVVWADLASRLRSGENWYGLQFQSIDDDNFKKLKALLEEAARAIPVDRDEAGTGKGCS